MRDALRQAVSAQESGEKSCKEMESRLRATVDDVHSTADSCDRLINTTKEKRKELELILELMDIYTEQKVCMSISAIRYVSTVVPILLALSVSLVI